MPAFDRVAWEEPADVDSSVARLVGPGARFVAVHRADVALDDRVLTCLRSALDAPLAATSSPVPIGTLPDADTVQLFDVRPHPALPPVPTLAVPDHRVVMVDRERARMAQLESLRSAPTIPEMIRRLGAGMIDLGWRNVAAPGVASSNVHVEVANEGLDAHQLWSDFVRRGPRIVVDGSCLTDDTHNGSQKLVLHITRALRQVRPEASIALAVSERFVGHVRRLVAQDGIDVVTRGDLGTPADLVYRPYQLLVPGELGWIVGSGRRVLIGQLDMIGFSNRSYHPSSEMFHTVRNLQRRTLRIADGVTFISEFARATTVAECPDLDDRRLFTVGCGTESEAPGPDGMRPIPGVGRFVSCVSATFWHKNRPFALRVFEALCDRHGYDGSLLIAGPEPYYGRSTAAEDDILASMPPDVAARVLRVGRLDDASKWWALAHSDLVLYPSTVEGFGLVPFEAAAVGTPALGHAGSALLEVVGPSMGLMESWDVERWADRAHQLISDPTARQTALREVTAAGDRLQWADIAVATWQAIDATVAAPRRMPSDEEGGIASRMAPRSRALAHGATASQLAQRVASAVQRRVHGRRRA